MISLVVSLVVSYRDTFLSNSVQAQGLLVSNLPEPANHLADTGSYKTKGNQHQHQKHPRTQVIPPFETVIRYDPCTPNTDN